MKMPVNETLNGDKNNNNVETERQQSSEQKSSAENVSEQKQPDDHLANTRVESDHSSIKSISPPSQPIQPQTNPTSLTKNESGSSKIELSQPLVNNQPEEKIKKDDNRLDKSSSIAIELDFNQSSAPSNGRKSTHFEEIRDQPQPSSENNVNESMHDEEMAKHSNTTESIQKLESNSSPQTIVDIQQQEPHSLPPMNSSSSELSHRTISLSDPDLHYMTMPAIVKIDKDKPSTAIDKSIKAMKNQSQPLSATTITKTATHHISFDRQNGIKYSPYSTVRSIRFEQNKPVTSKSMRALSHSSSHQIKLSTAKQHHKSTILKFAPETATLVPIGIEKSRHDISKSTRWKSTNLSHIQMEYNSDSEISDTTFEINNNYLDNNNASDNEAMAILPIEARELLMQDEEDRKSRLAKESTSLLRIPGLGTRRESKFFPGRIRKRVILKNGNINLCPEHVDRRSRRYLQDTFTTMVDIRWRWNLLVFAMGFLGSWLGFSIIWWLIAFSHSDFEHFHDEEWTPCVANLKNFGSAILFSIETQHTIGYGSRYTTEECPEAMFLMMLQSITGVMIQCFMVGFIFAKLSRPQKRSQTLMFSRYAIVNTRDGKMCLMFRVGDLRDRSHIIGAHISAQLIRKKMTTEGEVIPYYHQKLNVKFDEIDDEVFLIWPAIIVHVIDKDSPFYTMNVDDMTREKFEIIAILEGTVESTGQTIQARTSYLPSEILWGHRFEQLIRYRHDTGEYLVDYSKFNNTFDVDTPLCSAKELEEELQQSKNEDSESEHSDDDR